MYDVARPKQAVAARGFSLACVLVIAPYITSIAGFIPIRAGCRKLWAYQKFSALSDPGWTIGLITRYLPDKG